MRDPRHPGRAGPESRLHPLRQAPPAVHVGAHQRHTHPRARARDPQDHLPRRGRGGGHPPAAGPRHGRQRDPHVQAPRARVDAVVTRRDIAPPPEWAGILWFRNILDGGVITIPPGRHTFLSGRSGAGKSRLLRQLIRNMIPAVADGYTLLYGIDLKDGVELTPWSHWMAGLATDLDAAIGLLERVDGLRGERNRRLRDMGLANTTIDRGMPLIVVLIDEMGELAGAPDRDTKAKQEKARLPARPDPATGPQRGRHGGRRHAGPPQGSHPVARPVPQPDRPGAQQQGRNGHDDGRGRRARRVRAARDPVRQARRRLLARHGPARGRPVPHRQLAGQRGRTKPWATGRAARDRRTTGGATRTRCAGGGNASMRGRPGPRRGCSTARRAARDAWPTTGWANCRARHAAGGPWAGSRASGCAAVARSSRARSIARPHGPAPCARPSSAPNAPETCGKPSNTGGPVPGTGSGS
ncbi:hypothetical protein EMO90_03545 [Bifidobacterium vespertilionis]|uniref:AAA+ ATPase domain-containing protein n=1 Tax=Bifidobacterium vespertilionis TaxID=2562524 RepID=A0A5J5DY50_9BIFI|nr:hypothetical protein EMO90_03545 [Bifidobacterium vespertilionis]KAA8824833.1 hypothetical protein EM848_00840 [Bifidobacterium vespertilionis]